MTKNKLLRVKNPQYSRPAGSTSLFTASLHPRTDSPRFSRSLNKDAKKKIVLFSSNIKYVGVPLGLLSITELIDLRKYDIKIITRNEYPNYEEEIIKQCNGAVCFGISTITGFPVKIAKQISQKVKKKYSNLPIIWGGGSQLPYRKKRFKLRMSTISVWVRAKELSVSLSMFSRQAICLV